MGMALYRKYRTTNLAETLGQEHITKTLENALKTGRISHAYLFTGPRGVGKTSVARILAHEVNNLPYNEDGSHLDIIEIDAASNRRIDEIRDLRERVHTAPTSAKYKVYIIDEVHMLTKEAFNALLKTLEEPPEHVIFILATTESHKLPETIISRTQRFTFRPYDPEVIQARLRYIADRESINISDDALTLIAEAGGGSFRDSISLLDQASNASDTIGIDDVRRVLGIAPDEAMRQLNDAISAHDAAEVMNTLALLRESGYQSGQLAKQLLALFRTQMVNGQLRDPRVLALTTALLNVPTSHDVDASLDIALLTHALDGSTTTTATTPESNIAQPSPAAPRTVEKPQSAAQTPAPAPTTHKAKPESQIEPTKQPTPDPKVTTEPPQPISQSDEELWQRVLLAIKQAHNTIYSVTRMATPEFDSDQLTLYFAFPFHQKRINEPRNKQIISTIVSELAGKQIAVHCEVRKSDTVKPSDTPPAQATAAPDLAAVKDIFGDAEVLPDVS